ncbi:MAG TPA: response regulator [Ktedonobacterales bacterium]|nr:response regulator [Ktedonobacterales bacterium]
MSKHTESMTESMPASARAHLPTVCVIEDDEALRDTLRMLLEEEGYPVVEAADGLAGYRLLTETDQRLIALVDHKMPQMDGCDLLERMEQDATLRARHTYIMLSASPKQADEDCGETLEELEAPLVHKPFSIDEVLDAVAEAVQRLGAPSPLQVSQPDPSQPKTRRRTPRL